MRLRTKIRLWCLAHLLIVGGALAIALFFSRCHCAQKHIEPKNTSTNLTWFVEGSKFIWDGWKIK